MDQIVESPMLPAPRYYGLFPDSAKKTMFPQVTDFADECSAFAELLDRALAALAPEQRTCIVLSYHEGLSHGEIAEATGTPLGTVKSHIRRGTERLKTLMAAYEPATEEPNQ